MLLETLQFITGIFVVVFEGEHAVKFTLGKAGKVVEPGIHFKFPIIEKFVVKCTRDTALQLQEQTVQVAEDLVYNFSACLIYKIKDLRKAVVEISDLRDGLANLVATAVQQALKSRKRLEILDTQSVSESVTEIVKAKTDHWGVEIIHFGFSDLAPTQETAKVLQTQLLSKERVTIYQELVQDKGLAPNVAAALVSGAAMVVNEEKLHA